MGEYIVVTEAEISKKPKGVTHQEAATFPCVACAVWCSLVRTAILGSKRTKQQRLAQVFILTSLFVFEHRAFKIVGLGDQRRL